MGLQSLPIHPPVHLCVHSARALRNCSVGSGHEAPCAPVERILRVLLLCSLITRAPLRGLHKGIRRKEFCRDPCIRAVPPLVCLACSRRPPAPVARKAGNLLPQQLPLLPPQLPRALPPSLPLPPLHSSS